MAGREVASRGRLFWGCDVCAMARSSQQLQGHDPSGTGPRSGSAVLCGPISFS
jgi:hypothetical protein